MKKGEIIMSYQTCVIASSEGNGFHWNCDRCYEPLGNSPFNCLFECSRRYCSSGCCANDLQDNGHWLYCTGNQYSCTKLLTEYSLKNPFYFLTLKFIAKTISCAIQDSDHMIGNELRASRIKEDLISKILKLTASFILSNDSLVNDLPVVETFELIKGTFSYEKRFLDVK
jgi:hypothetical protein